MKLRSKCFGLAIVICILFSAMAVSAEDMDMNQTMEMDSDDSLEVLGDKSYDNLRDDIMNSSGTFDMQDDYKYDESDNSTFLEFNADNLVINGNNNVIDGAGIAGGFKFTNDVGTVTINDLTFMNCNKSAITAAGKLILNNVNFTNNHKQSAIYGIGGIVFIEEKGGLIADNCNFYSNNNSNCIFAKMPIMWKSTIHTFPMERALERLSMW
jgi:hypothetical protein